MRYFLYLLLLIPFTLTGALAVEVSGAVVFVKVTDDADGARTNVYEQRLAGGEAKLLVAAAALPTTFRGRIERALPSADGALLLLEESDGFVIKNTKTGATRLVLGSGYSTIGGEVLAEQFDGGCWLWSRATGTVKKIAPAAAHERTEPLGWSPRGELLLAHVANTKTHSETLRVFDAATGKTRILRTVQELILARWTPDAAAVFVVDQPKEKTTRLTLAPLNGKAQPLFNRPGRVFMAAISPDGRQVALGDKGGFYLYSRDGRTKRKLTLPAVDGFPDGNMAFSADGGRLAILSSSTGSGPYANEHEELWTIEIKTAAARRVAQWDVTLGNSPGEDTTHQLLGWASGQPTLLVMGLSCTVQGTETEWRKLWLQAADPTQPARLLTDSGPRGIAMSWWGGQL
ncbi:MAG: hypothetical protein ACYDBB_27160 [Armatimonadota bacterium]